jgi:hypothetical protein
MRPTIDDRPSQKLIGLQRMFRNTGDSRRSSNDRECLFAGVVFPVALQVIDVSALITIQVSERFPFRTVSASFFVAKH